MKKIILIISLVLVTLSVFGQENKAVDQYLRESKKIRKECDKMKDGKKEKAQGYKQALEKQDTAITELQESVNQYKKYTEYEQDAKIYRFLSRTDAKVFTDNDTLKDAEKLPSFMHEQYQAILTIREYYLCIKEMEKTIEEAKNNKKLVNEVDRKQFVAMMIKKNIDQANDLLNRIEKIKMSSFSDEQTKFYQNLSDELSAILDKYIF